MQRNPSLTVTKSAADDADEGGDYLTTGPSGAGTAA